MTAPDPTAGERECRCPCHETTLNGLLAAHTGPCSCTVLSTEAVDVLNEVRDGDTTRLHAMFDADPLPTSPPAVAASTGTSEDVETLQRLIVSHLRADKPDEYDEAAWSAAGAVLASDWLAARESAARAEERERIAQAIEALPGPEGVGLSKWTHSKAVEGYLLAIEEAVLAARIAREVRP